MKHPIKITALICIGLLTLAACAAMAQCGCGGDKKAMGLLKKSCENMDLIARKLLPKTKVGRETQDKEEYVIKNFDELIKIIIDEQNDSRCRQCPGDYFGGDAPGDLPVDTHTLPGGRGEGAPDTDGINKGTGQEWGPLPKKDYDPTAETGDSDYPAGYDELIKQFRKIYQRETAGTPGR